MDGVNIRQADFSVCLDQDRKIFIVGGLIWAAGEFVEYS